MESRLHANFLDGHQRRIDVEPIESGIFALNQKAAPGLEGVHTRLLRLLDDDTLDVLAFAFAARLSGCPGHVAPVQDWLKTLLWGVPKGKGQGRHTKEWRGISVVAALSKVYENVLFRILEERHLAVLHPALLGYRKGRQTLDLTEFLRIAAGNSLEWNEPL